MTIKILSRSSDQIHLWIPAIFEFKGGIQVYSAFFLQALQNSYPNYDYRVLLKNDTEPNSDWSFLETTKFQFTGTVPSPIRKQLFATQLLATGILHRPNLVIATLLRYTPCAYLLKRIAQVPYWTIAHGVDAWNAHRYPALKVGLTQADRILAVSNYTRDQLIKTLDINPDQVDLLPNTFDAQRFQIGTKPQYLLDRYHLKPTQPIILTVSRLSGYDKYKGHDQILNALPEIRRHFPDIHYLITGTGDDIPRIQQLIQKLNLQTAVTLTGFIPDSELRDHYNLCDVFAMPSSGEGFGIVYLEALACGKPTLGGNQDGAIDALLGGEIGALVNPKNIDEIAATLIQILQGNYPNPRLYQPEYLRSRVIAEYGFNRFQKTLAELFSEHFDQKNQPSIGNESYTQSKLLRIP